MVFSADDCTDCDVFALNALEKGCSVYDQGDTALQFYYVKEGLVGLYHILENGKSSLVRLYKKGDFFGFRTFFGNKNYHCSAIVMVKAQIICIRPHSIDSFFSKNIELVRFLVFQLAQELHDAETRLAKIAYNKTLDRVFNTTRFLAEHYPEYPWTYREIAEYSGCETETAIRITKELHKTGLLQSHKINKKTSDN